LTSGRRCTASISLSGFFASHPVEYRKPPFLLSEILFYSRCEAERRNFCGFAINLINTDVLHGRSGKEGAAAAPGRFE
jgi:hypothetical protein